MVTTAVVTDALIKIFIGLKSYLNTGSRDNMGDFQCAVGYKGHWQII